MGVFLPAYCTREDVKTAADILQTANYNVHIDSAIQAAPDDVIGLCHRRFHNVDETHYFDWPSYQYAYPWRIWMDDAELADVTVNVPVVTSGGNVIPNADLFWGDPNHPKAPFNELQLSRATNASFGQGSTPQRDVAVTGTFGYWTNSKSVGTLAAAINSTSATTCTVSNGSLVGVGDTITVDSERMLVSERAFSDTTTVQSAGCTTAVNNDDTLTVVDGTKVNAGEVIQLDSESMLVMSVTGNNAAVVRAYDGSTLATHSAGVGVFASRLLTVLRGQFGTTAATHSNSAPVTALLVPAQVRELAIAYSLVYVAQKSAAYAREISQGGAPIAGQGITNLEDRVFSLYGRKARQRVI